MRDKKTGWKWLMLGVSMGFYLFFAFYDGTVICVDSPTYINWESSREPLYPLFLALLRFLLGGTGEGYLFGVVLLQSILAGISTFALSEYLRQECRLKEVEAFFLLLIPMAVSLLCRYAAGRGSMYSNSILTEGIAVSGYLLFFRFLMEFVFHHTRKGLLCGAFLAFLLYLTRKQMILCLFMLGAAILYVYGAKKKKWLRSMALFAACLIGVLGSAKLVDGASNYLFRGRIMTHTSDVRFLATVGFYAADREDGELFTEKEIRELFYEIYDPCAENDYLMPKEQESWANRVSHFADNYDKIQIDTMWPKVDEFVQRQYDCTGEEINLQADRVMKELGKCLLFHNSRKVLLLFFDNFREGLVTTVAKVHPILNWYSVFIYLLYAALFAFLIIRKGNQRILLFAGSVLVSVLGNVGLVSLVIFCQSRYTIYNMVLFYSGLFLLGRESLQQIKQIRKR